jgi:hypothetical protein
MGHPYNYWQQIVLHNLSAQRFVGTDIQKNILYGRDIPVFRFDYTGAVFGIDYDYGSIHYDLLKSGDFVKLYTDRGNLNAEPYYIVRGEPVDYPLVQVNPSGLERYLPFDRPLVAYAVSGFATGCVTEFAYNKHEYIDSDVIDIDYDRPWVVPRVPSAGTMLGITKNKETAGFYFETGTVFPGDYLPVGFDYPSAGEEVYGTAQFFFWTGTVDGPSN